VIRGGGLKIGNLRPLAVGLTLCKNINLSRSDPTAKSFRRTFYLTIAVLQTSRAVQTTSSAQARHRYRSTSTFYMPSRISVVQGVDPCVTVVGALLSVFPLTTRGLALTRRGSPITTLRPVLWCQSLCVSRFEFVTEVITDTSAIRPLCKRMNDSAPGIFPSAILMHAHGAPTVLSGPRPDHPA
jgi:hypothetical protein